MSNKVQLIKQEIERIEQILDDFNKTHNNTIDNGIVSAKKNICKHIKSFIDSLPEEPASEDTCLLGHDYKNRDCENCSFELCKRFSKPVNEDLEEELHSWMKENCDNNGFFNQLELARHFAKWQKQQMMKDVVLETKVLMDCDGDGIETPYKEWLTLEDTEIPCVPDSFKEGDIVKVILVKEDLP